jgi:hypothetical protein
LTRGYKACEKESSGVKMKVYLTDCRFTMLYERVTEAEVIDPGVALSVAVLVD